jgi:hypothetical protein
VSNQTAADPKATAVQLAVDHWKVAPGGAGIVLEYDNQHALVVHDLAKPITIEDVAGERPSIGWHYIAAFPVDAQGRAAGPVTLARFAWSAKHTRDEVAAYEAGPMVIVNRPLLGTQGVDGQQGPGTLIAKHAALELLLWSPQPRTDCVARLGSSRIALDETGEHAMHVALPGRYELGELDHQNDADVVSVSVECPVHRAVPMLPSWQGAAILMYVK